MGIGLFFFTINAVKDKTINPIIEKLKVQTLLGVLIKPIKWCGRLITKPRITKVLMVFDLYSVKIVPTNGYSARANGNNKRSLSLPNEAENNVVGINTIRKGYFLKNFIVISEKTQGSNAIGIQALIIVLNQTINENHLSPPSINWLNNDCSIGNDRYKRRNNNKVIAGVMDTKNFPHS